MEPTHTDPAAIADVENRAARLYSIYGPAGRTLHADFRDRYAEQLLRAELARREADRLFAAPIIQLDDGRQL